MKWWGFPGPCNKLLHPGDVEDLQQPFWIMIRTLKLWVIQKTPTWKAKERPIFNPIVAGFRGFQVASKNRTHPRRSRNGQKPKKLKQQVNRPSRRWPTYWNLPNQNGPLERRSFQSNARDAVWFLARYILVDKRLQLTARICRCCSFVSCKVGDPRFPRQLRWAEWTKKIHPWSLTASLPLKKNSWNLELSFWEGHFPGVMLEFQQVQGKRGWIELVIFKKKGGRFWGKQDEATISHIYIYIYVYIYIYHTHPWKLTWNLKVIELKRKTHLPDLHFWDSMLIFGGTIKMWHRQSRLVH